jgi:hypothetical protein
MKVWAWILAAATLGYLVLLAWRGGFLIRSGDPMLIVFGLAIAVFPLLGLWFLWRELRFGYVMQAMGRQLAQEGGLAGQDTVQADSDWRDWYRLALHHDQARDRRKARAAMREAARLYLGT